MGALELPVGIRHVFHADLHPLPAALKRWFLAALDRGTDVVAIAPRATQVPSAARAPSSADTARAAGAGPGSDRLEIRLEHFPSDAGRQSALIEAASSGRYRCFVFESDAGLRQFHLSCICLSSVQPYARRASVLFYPSLRLLHACLDWLVSESEGAIDTVFAMLDGVRSHWRAFATTHQRPVDLDRAIRSSLIDAAESETSAVRLVAALASLRADFLLAGNDVRRADLLEHFVGVYASYAPAPLTTDIPLICDFLRSSPVTLGELQAAVTRTWSLPGVSGPDLVGPLDPVPSMDGEWLWVPDRSFDRGTVERLSRSQAFPPVVFALAADPTHE